MRRRLKEIMGFWILQVVIVFLLLFIFGRNQNGASTSNYRPPNREPGSWFLALATAWNKLDNVVQVLRRSSNRSCLFKCEHEKETYIGRYPFFEKDFKIDKERLATWLKNTSIVTFCDSKMKVFDRKFVLMQNVTLNAYKWDVLNFAKGGEELTEFKDKYMRDDKNEILQPKKGLFAMSCTHHEYLDELSSDEVPLLKYTSFSRINKDTDKLALSDRRKSIVRPDYVSNFTIAIAREDYANIYHVTLHTFNIFLMLMAFKQQPLQISILLLDAHPKAETDDFFLTLFGPLIRIGHLKRSVYFKNLVLSIPENKSPLSKYSFLTLAYLEEFRSFVLNRYFINNSSVQDCKEIKITLIWRRDKVYHPRNMMGSVQRKIFNEAELFQTLDEKYPQHCIRGFLLETMPMVEQLKIIKNTDILIGMHGAGLTHTLYLPKESGLIELFPFKFKQSHSYYKLFEAIAKWRGLHYMSWENTDVTLEMNNYYTIINVAEIAALVENMVKLICG